MIVLAPVRMYGAGRQLAPGTRGVDKCWHVGAALKKRGYAPIDKLQSCAASHGFAPNCPRAVTLAIRKHQ